jgi:hypothetical protein
VQLPRYLVVKSGVTRTPSELGGSIQSRVTRSDGTRKRQIRLFRWTRLVAPSVRAICRGCTSSVAFHGIRFLFAVDRMFGDFAEAKTQVRLRVEFVRLSRLEQLEDGYLLGPLSKAVHNTGVPSNSSTLAVVAQVWMQERNPRRGT